jgi:thiamine-monophosphate kinase
VLSGGDDYELLFTAPREQRPEIESLAAELGLAITRIGVIEAGSGLRILDAEGKPIAHRGGFDHFGDRR